MTLDGKLIDKSGTMSGSYYVYIYTTYTYCRGKPKKGAMNLKFSFDVTPGRA